MKMSKKEKFYLETNGFTGQKVLYNEKLWQMWLDFCKTRNIESIALHLVDISIKPTTAGLVMSTGHLLQYQSIWLNNKELKKLEDELNDQ